MTARGPGLEHANANRARQIYGLLRGRVLTTSEIAAELGMTCASAARALSRLRHEMGIEIAEVGEDEPEVVGHGDNHGAYLYTVLLPEGRICADPGCDTVLCRRNPSRFCTLHGGWRG